MQIADFKSIVATFSDPGSELLFEKTKVVLSVNGVLIEADLSSSSGDVYVHEAETRVPASTWIINRLANLPLLAARLQDNVTPTQCFVSPAAEFLPTLEKRPESKPHFTSDALATALGALHERSPLETTVLYITSDAGEGKTSLINELARAQASSFKERKSDWLLVPIPLGGRHFLRFDDITVGVLQNRYRFPFLYWDSFLALVRMGVIVPAFDGFEEMFVESSSGEALSAMGILVNSLDSRGAIVVAARRAYFEFESLKDQERLLDSIRSHCVGFGKLELRRWTKDQFVAYGTKRGLPNSGGFYSSVAGFLREDHALLTRAVLVRRLIDVAEATPLIDDFLLKLARSGPDYFAVFVRGLIEREADEKWIDRSGDLGQQLLSPEQHIELLGQVAVGMWEAKVDYLKKDNLDFVSDYYCDSTRKSAFQAQQIRERLRGHAMLVPSRNAALAVEFDHPEFKDFFLGEGVSSLLGNLDDRAKGELLGVFRRGALPQHARESLQRAILRSPNCDRIAVVHLLLDVARLDAQASYTHENCSTLILPLLSGLSESNLDIVGLVFSTGVLEHVSLSGIRFRNCYFAPTSLRNTTLKNCAFVGCTFAQLRHIDRASVRNVDMAGSTVEALKIDESREIWAPSEILKALVECGFSVEAAPPVASAAPVVDQTLRDFEKIVRYFLRSTHMSESVILIKLGERGPFFISTAVPELLRRGLLVEIENKGGNNQRRFRLGFSREAFEQALARSNGSYLAFLEGLT